MDVPICQWWPHGRHSHVEPCGTAPPPTVAMEAHILPEPWTPDISYTRDFQRLFKQWKSFLIGSPCETPDIKTHIR